MSLDPLHSIRMLVEWNPVPGIQNLRRGIQNLGFSYMGQSRAVLVRTSMPPEMDPLLPSNFIPIFIGKLE